MRHPKRSCRLPSAWACCSRLPPGAGDDRRRRARPDSGGASSRAPVTTVFVRVPDAKHGGHLLMANNVDLAYARIADAAPAQGTCAHSAGMTTITPHSTRRSPSSPPGCRLSPQEDRSAAAPAGERRRQRHPSDRHRPAVRFGVLDQRGALHKELLVAIDPVVRASVNRQALKSYVAELRRSSQCISRKPNGCAASSPPRGG